MRKHDARKWLHAVLDLLPVVLIPIFALYATNKNATFIQEITVSENKVSNFNQLVQNGNFESFDNWNLFDVNATNFVISSNELEINIVNDTFSYWQYGFYQTIPTLTIGNKYVVRITLDSSTFSSYRVEILSGNATNLVNGFNSVLIEPTVEYGKQLGFYPLGNYNINTSYTVKNIQVFNLTQMFGAGNEPTIQQFNDWYSNDYYDYTLSQKQLLKDIDQITYNDTDIGSQFMYGLYNSVDKYFNIGNVFNLGSIYDWLNLNIFNGNSPIAIYIVWNIVAYEFLMDLLFLLYGLFMFFIDTCSNLMERFYCNLSGRR